MNRITLVEYLRHVLTHELITIKMKIAFNQEKIIIFSSFFLSQYNNDLPEFIPSRDIISQCILLQICLG